MTALTEPGDTGVAEIDQARRRAGIRYVCSGLGLMVGFVIAGQPALVAVGAPLLIVGGTCLDKSKKATSEDAMHRDTSIVAVMVAVTALVVSLYIVLR